MKKLFLLVAFLMMSIIIWAQSGMCGDNLKWEYSRGTLTISGSGPMDDYTYQSTPWYWNYREDIVKVIIKDGVTSIGNHAFDGCKELSSINISNSVTSIGDYAFDSCRELTSITIPESVVKIGNHIFRYCKSLTSIEVASENPNYDSRDNCNAVIKTSSNTLYIGCKNTVIPNSVTSIGNHAFYCCLDLFSIDIPVSVTSIGEYSFSSCSSLTSIAIPKSVTSIGNGAFYSCTSLTSIIIPDGVETIGEYAFENCSGLKSITIGNSVKSIGDAAFQSCKALTSIIIGNSLRSISKSIFSGCNSLSSIIVDPGNPIYDSRDNCNAIIESVTNTLIIGFENTIIPSSVTTIGSNAFSGCTGLTSITIPEGVENILNYAFSGCNGLKSVTIGNTVTNIGDYAFQNCTGLTSIIIPNGVETVGNSAFYKCSRLQSVTIGNSVRGIGDSAFQDCIGLTSVTIPYSVTTIGGYAFKDCIGLASVTFENPKTYIGYKAFEGTPWYEQSEVYGYVIYKGTVACGYEKTMPRGTSIVLREGTTEIASRAFQDCKQLNSITIPSSVITVGDYAFSYCTGLTSIIIPNSVKTICDGAFSHCTGLTSIIIPNSVLDVGNSVFSWCSGLTSITVDSENTNYDSRENCNAIIETASNTLLRGCENTVIPNSVTSIGNHAFSGYTNLTSIIIPNSVTNIGSNVFSGCSNLTSVTIPNSVTYVGKDAFYWEKDTENWTYQFYVPWYKNLPDGLVYIGKVAYAYKGTMPDNTSIVLKEGTKEVAERAFSGCAALTSITIPNTVTTIRDYAFLYCTGLTSVTIPNTVTSIRDYAFKNCTGLTSLTISNGVTSIGYHAFDNCTSLTSITIPYSVTSIQSYAFQNCSNLSSVTLENPNTSIGYGAFDGTLWYDGQSEVSGYVVYNGSVACGYEETMPVGTSIVLREGTTEIASSAFSGCENMVSITIPNSVKSIDNSSFKDCSNLASIILPNSVTSIGSGAFSGCSSLKTVTLHCSTIGTWFVNNTSITEIIIGKEVTSIAADAFNGCSGLISVVFHCPTIESWFADNTSISEVIIGDEVNCIGNYAFKGCSGLTSLNIPNSLKSIGSLVFMGCNNLSSLVIPESVTDIGSRAFAGCAGLTTVSIPSSVTKIREHTFNGCRNLTSVALPSSLTSIGDYTFLNCNSLEYILSRSMNPPSISSSSIGNSKSILVQNNALKAYQTTDIWKDLKYISYETTPVFLKADKENLKGTSCHFKYYPIDEAHNYGEKDNGEECIVYGLNPETSQSGVSVEWKMKDGNYGTAILDVLTTELTLDTQEPITLSEKKGRLIANTTEDDDMIHYGFEWRRYDAPEVRPSNKVSAPLFYGTIVGTLNNLNPDVDYKYRPYYKSDDGTMYYGEWMWLYTGDASVFFEPEVYTKDASDITKVSALLAGIWVEGTDDFTEKGFEYWTVSGSKTRTVGSDVKTVIVTGNKLTSIIDGLKSGTEYGYRSYAKTASGTTYGEEKTFKTIPIMGDANGDGELNGTDRNYIARHIMGDTPDDFDEEAANLNGDEKIDAVDLVLLNNLLKEQ